MTKNGRPKEEITLTKVQRAKLENLAVTTEVGSVSCRAEVILLSGSGFDSSEITKRVGLSEQSICKWRRRYLELGIEGLRDAPRPGRSRKELCIREEEYEELVCWSKSRSLPESIVNRAKVI